ncbi:hypothetical protein HQQ81_18665 [Microbacteriaceae bacterium VKM Ac-2854]|nr:hypothetical protein [Microbacteriaceae bacterium VKM Ac-2854]
MSRKTWLTAATLTTALALSALGGASSAAASTGELGGADALLARSEAVAVQPLRTDADDGIVASDSTSDTAEKRNEPVWTRTCSRGYGDEIWNNIDATNCAGTVTYYKYNVADGHVNMLAFLASEGGRGGDLNSLRDGLNAWCDDHSFDCAMATGIILIPVAVLFSVISGGSTT